MVFIIKVGENASITADIHNDGGQSGTVTVTLKINGIEIDSQDITLSPGQDKQVTFDLFGNDQGEYTIDVGDLSGSFNSVIWINWWLIAGLSAALALIIWAIWYYGFYRRKHTHYLIDLY